jgi:hypothetical protein
MIAPTLASTIDLMSKPRTFGLYAEYRAYPDSSKLGAEYIECYYDPACFTILRDEYQASKASGNIEAFNTRYAYISAESLVAIIDVGIVTAVDHVGICELGYNTKDAPLPAWVVFHVHVYKGTDTTAISCAVLGRVLTTTQAPAEGRRALILGDAFILGLSPIDDGFYPREAIKHMLASTAGVSNAT